MEIVQLSLLPDTKPKRKEIREKPKQLEMFKAREIVHFGVSSRPKFHFPATAHLFLQREDPRTEEEIEKDAMLAAKEMTESLFKE